MSVGVCVNPSSYVSKFHSFKCPGEHLLELTSIIL